MVLSQRVEVDVVVSTLDRPALLGRCLDALLAGTRQPARVVVVDQGDASGTSEVLAVRRARGLPVDHVVQARRGLSSSQNLGVSTAGSPVVAVVDDDCVPDRCWLEVIDREFTAAPGPLLLTGRIEPLPPDGVRTRAVSSRTSTRRRRFDGGALPWEVGTGGNFAVTRSSFLAVGGNDEHLGTGTPGLAGNDVDLFARLLRAGVPALYEPDSLVLHERSTQAEHRSRRRTYGFGVGAMIGRLLRVRDRRAGPLLLGWVRLRLSRVRADRRLVGEEGRVLLGTFAGLRYGLRLAPRAGAAVR